MPAALALSGEIASPPFRPMKRFLSALLACLLVARAAAASDTLSFQQQLQTDLRRDVERLQLATVAERATNTAPTDFYFPYLLAGLTHLHEKTGEAILLDWAKEDLMWIVRSSIGADGKAKPFFTGFRFYPAFCGAYNYLKAHHALTPTEAASVATQIIASTDLKLDRTDFGAQNRGFIYGAEYLIAAQAVPDAPLVARWKQNGEALTYDSLHGWSVEDASIYEPFWFNFILLVAELKGDTAERMKPITTRYYFDHTKELLLPNGLMPDWGDGDWTHSWMWNVANLVRAGSVYRDGTYPDANRAYYKDFPAEAIAGVGLALHWLDATVPLAPLTQDKSAEVVDDLISKKIVFRGAAGSYVLFNYRDEGPYGRFTRDYQNAQLDAHEEKPHHGHADENAFGLLMQEGTVLLADGGYRATFARGWRADIFHNRIVARSGFPSEGDVWPYLAQDATYHEVQTEKIHFGTFGSLDYARTRLVDEERGYTGDRITLFAPESGLTIVVDSLLIDRAGNKVFSNTWHPDHILAQGDNYVVSHPDRIPIRTEYWPNPHSRDLVIQFLGNRDKVANTREIDRRFNPSQVFYQYLKNYFFKGQRLTFVTVLRPIAAGTFAPALLDDVKLITDAHDDGRTLGLQFTLGDEPVTVGLKLDQTIGLTHLRGRPMFDATTGAVEYGALTTDADFAFVRDRKDGSREFAFQYATALAYAGATLFQQPVWDGMFQGPEKFSVPDRRDKMPRWHDVAPAAKR
jgi:hypothetical protein